MTSASGINSQTRIDLMRFLGRETASASQDEFSDKLRMLIIILLCSNDHTLVTDALKAVKTANPEKMTS